MIRSPQEVYTECEQWGEDQVQAHLDAHPEEPERLHRLEWLHKKARSRTDAIDPEWAAVSEDAQRALLVAWANGMPPLASALYGRWWQLEAWLRSLLYVELRAARGSNWADVLSRASERRQQGEGDFHYMATPDAQNRLAYADASALFQITLDHWDLFADYFPAKTVWTGRIEELKAIRNRIGHCRRPHTDDLIRLEQTLRDLDGGARSATASFNRQWLADNDWTDAVVDGWIRRNHETANRLIDHADRQYDTLFELRFSQRHWAESFGTRQTISGIPGYIWHAFWYFRRARPFHLDRFWRDIRQYHDLVLIVCSDSPLSLSVSFAAMEEPKRIADAIGSCFDAALNSLGHGARSEEYYSRWRAQYADLDPRVHVGATPWAMVDDAMGDVSIFGA